MDNNEFVNFIESGEEEKEGDEESVSVKERVKAFEFKSKTKKEIIDLCLKHVKCDVDEGFLNKLGKDELVEYYDSLGENKLKGGYSGDVGGEGVFRLLVLGGMGVETAASVCGIDLKGFCSDVAEDKDVLMPICKDVYKEYGGHIDGYVNPLVNLGMAVGMRAMNRYAKNSVFRDADGKIDRVDTNTRSGEGTDCGSKLFVDNADSSSSSGDGDSSSGSEVKCEVYGL